MRFKFGMCPPCKESQRYDLEFVAGPTESQRCNFQIVSKRIISQTHIASRLRNGTHRRCDLASCLRNGAHRRYDLASRLRKGTHRRYDIASCLRNGTHRSYDLASCLRSWTHRRCDLASCLRNGTHRRCDLCFLPRKRDASKVRVWLLPRKRDASKAGPRFVFPSSGSVCLSKSERSKTIRLNTNPFVQLDGLVRRRWGCTLGAIRWPIDRSATLRNPTSENNLELSEPDPGPGVQKPIANGPLSGHPSNPRSPASECDLELSGPDPAPRICNRFKDLAQI